MHSSNKIRLFLVKNPLVEADKSEYCHWDYAAAGGRKTDEFTLKVL
ncbi:MAG: hypothetical protein WCL01_10600 [Comamonadaceae bacterium]